MADTQLAFDLDHIPDREAPPVPWKHILPDLLDKVHGIKSMSPCIVQCDGCGKTATGEKVALTVILAHIVFNQLAGRPGLRQCTACWARDGWIDSASRGWQETHR